VTISPNDGQIIHDTSSNSLNWGTTPGFSSETTYTAVIKGPMDGTNTFKHTITMTLNVFKSCISLTYTPLTLSTTIRIDGVTPSSSSSHSFGTFLTGAATDCLIRYSYVVKNSAGTDVSTTLASLLTFSPASNVDSSVYTATVSIA
jgi:hypothetical protein